MKEKTFKGKLITIFSIILGFLWLAPIIWLVGTALSEPSIKMSFLPKTGFTLDNIKYVCCTICDFHNGGICLGSYEF